MRFVIQTTYDQKGMTAMARTLRKTIRRKKSIRTISLAAWFWLWPRFC